MKKIHCPSPNFNERLRPVDMVVLHYTDMPTAKGALDWLTHPESQVSAHYLIDKDGKIYQMVDEHKRAWHAGPSFWQNATDMNSCSLGIEIVNPGHSHGYVPFPERQIASLLELLQDIQKRWAIPQDRFLGHSDVAPGRKQDPGHLFPWKRLAEEGFGLWPIPSFTDPRIDLEKGLAAVGYDVSSLIHALLAFQRHFQPHKVDGIADEETYALLQGLLKISPPLI